MIYIYIVFVNIIFSIGHSFLCCVMLQLLLPVNKMLCDNLTSTALDMCYKIFAPVI